MQDVRQSLSLYFAIVLLKRTADIGHPMRKIATQTGPQDEFASKLGSLAWIFQRQLKERILCEM
jgi:hypothetical protein